MIIVVINGGIGSQLFQYAAAYELAKKTNQFCNNCKHFEEKNCTFWGAIVKSGFWCKSWKEGL